MEALEMMEERANNLLLCKLAQVFYSDVATQMDQHPEDNVADAAERFWTSPLLNSGNREPCSILSECVRFTPETVVKDIPKVMCTYMLACFGI